MISVRSAMMRILGTGVAVQALIWSSAAYAQSADVAPTVAQATSTPSSQTDPAMGSNGPAIGQGASAIPFGDAKGGSYDQEIVVTGTLLRGKAPVGSNFISLGQDRINEVGAISANDLLASLPQVTNYFNNVPSTDLSQAVNQFQISRPNIRNISVTNAAESATLVLFDGHRIATAGVSQSSVDPDVIPTGAIERVEVLTEGGSATYGTDAVAGVINFITRKRFDGITTDARYGFADDYWQTNASVTGGKDWGSGSAYISYTFTKNDALFGRDRGFIRGLDYTSQPYGPSGVGCSPPVLQIGFSRYGTRCDLTDDLSVVPRIKRHGVIFSLFQKLDDTTSVDLKAFYSRRETTSLATQTGAVNLTPNNPYYQLPDGVAPSGQTIGVNFNFDPVTGRSGQRNTTLLQEWGANAEFKKDLGANWQLRTLFNYSGSDTSFRLPQPNTGRLNAAGASSDPMTAFDPFDLSQTNPAIIADVLDNELSGQARDNLFNIRPILEGKLFALPGGDVRLAVGYEYIRDEFQQRYQTDIRLGTLKDFPFNTYNRTVQSVFGELSLPIVGADNAMTGIQSLVVTASGRFDHYSDFGSTTNPKVGASYKPVDWLTIRGNWGTSFTAPSPLDQLGSNTNTVSAFPFVAFTRPGDNPGAAYTIAVLGSLPNLKPQTATTWSVGFDAQPPVIPGLRASLSYYNVTFKDILSTPVVNAQILNNFPDQITTSVAGLTADQLRAYESFAGNGASVIEPIIASGARVYEFVDFRVNNFGILKVDGFDFSASYKHGFGSVEADLSVSGDYQLHRQQQYSATSPVIDVLKTDFPKLTMQTTIGATIGRLRAQAVWNHTSGFDITPVGTPPQTHLGAFDTVDLFFKYDIAGESGMTKGLSFTLNVNNVADTDPPAYRGNGPSDRGYFPSPNQEFTLGRMFMFGVSKSFK